jgi:hypothetical protein
MSTHHITRRPLGRGPAGRSTSGRQPAEAAAPATYRAQLVSAGLDGPGWKLFIVLPGRVSNWPEATWSARNVPSVQRRAEALTDMGYALADAGAGWQWAETQTWEEDPGAPVELTAVAMVTPVG